MTKPSCFVIKNGPGIEFSIIKKEAQHFWTNLSKTAQVLEKPNSKRVFFPTSTKSNIFKTDLYMNTYRKHIPLLVFKSPYPKI